MKFEDLETNFEMSTRSECSSDDEIDNAIVALTSHPNHAVYNAPDIFTCIKEGDMNTFKETFFSLSIPERKMVVNGERYSTDRLNISYTALQLAACMGQKGICSFLMAQCADVTQPNVHGKNVVHLLVDIAKHRPKLGINMYAFIMRQCSLTDKRELLNTRYEGCPPHVYAIQNGNMPMADVIIRTDDVYRHVKERYGTYDVVQYDLHIDGTDPHECPISALLKLGLDQVKTPENKNIILCRPWATWLSKIWSEYHWIAFFWFLGRLIHLILLTICCVNRPIRMNKPFNSTFDSGYNEDAVNNHLALERLILACAILAILSNILRLLKPSSLGHISRYVAAKCKNLYKTVRRIKKPDETHLTQGKLFWSLSLLMHVSFLLSYSFAMSNYNFEDITLSLSVVLCYISMLFFCTMLPNLGHFSIIIEQTVWDIINFSLFYLFILLGFSAAFFTLYQMESVDEFKTYPQTIFTVFHMTFDPVSFSSLASAREPVAAVICFTIYSVIVVVALLNFLIAIMSQTVADITESKHIAFSLNRASVALFLQKYPLVRKLRRGVLKMLRCICRCCDDPVSDGICSVTVVEYVGEEAEGSSMIDT